MCFWITTVLTVGVNPRTTKWVGQHWPFVGKLLSYTLAHNKIFQPYCTIGQRTICQQSLNGGPTVSYSKSCSDTLQTRGISVPTLYHYPTKSQPYLPATVSPNCQRLGNNLYYLGNKVITFSMKKCLFFQSIYLKTIS